MIEARYPLRVLNGLSSPRVDDVALSISVSMGFECFPVRPSLPAKELHCTPPLENTREQVLD